MGSHTRALAGLIAPGCLVAACSFASLDDLQSGVVTSGGAGGANPATTTTGTSESPSSSNNGSTGIGGTGGDGGGAIASGTGGAGGASSAGGVGGDGGQGGVDPGPPDLVDTSLLLRYFLDEAERGVEPSHVFDAAPNPLNLSINYPDDDGMQFATEDGHVGLSWVEAGKQGGPSESVAGKLLSLNASFHATIEVVVRADQVTGYGSRLMHIGVKYDSCFTMALSNEDGTGGILPPNRVELRTCFDGANGREYRTMPFAAPGIAGDRVVLHAVYDSQEDLAEDRVRVFVNGDELTRIEVDPPPAWPEPSERLRVGDSHTLWIGNRDDGDRSIEGTIFYAAMYRAALDDDEIAHNVEALLARDDG